MIVRTRKLVDREVLHIASSMLARFPGGNAIIGLPMGSSVSFNANKPTSEYEYSLEHRNIRSMQFHFEGNGQHFVAFARDILNPERKEWDSPNNHHPSNFVNWRTQSGYYDELAIIFLQNGATASNPLNADDFIFISELFDVYSASVQLANDDQARVLSNAISQQLDELRRLNLDMTSGLASARLKSDTVLAEQRNSLEASYSEKFQELSKKTDELERRRIELDDREPQHERRKLRKELTQRLQDSIKLNSNGRYWTRNSVYFIYLLISALTVAAAIDLNYKADGSTGLTAVYIFSLKSIALTGAGLAFAWAGLSGLKNATLAKQAQDREIERYSFDMDRASWIVETILQMNSIEKSSMPDEWLLGVCRDLFSVKSSESDSNKSLESFAALFDATARAKIGTNGVEFEIDRKGAKKLAAD